MINRDEFKALMSACIIPEVLNSYIEQSEVDYLQAIHDLYQSNLFKKLSNKRTCLWHLSPKQLAILLKEEIESGNLDIPEGLAL